MKSSVVGYTGGTSAYPTYLRIGDHSEAILIEFDNPLSYEDILRKFFAEHTPGVSSRQYRSAIFVHDQHQRDIAEAMKVSLIEQGKRWCKHTAVENAGLFYKAEDYHQNYLRNLLHVFESTS